LNVIVDRVFRYQDRIDVIYDRGQPIGVKSSFEILALLNHVLHRLAFIKAGKQFKIDVKSENTLKGKLSASQNELYMYGVNGDDDFIVGKDVFNKFKEICSKYDIPLNQSKSIVHPGSHSVAEFSSRLFIDGREITQFPVKIITGFKEDQSLIYQILEFLKDRSYINKDTLKNFITYIYKSVKPNKIKFELFL
jgi:hypothetical protein